MPRQTLSHLTLAVGCSAACVFSALAGSDESLLAGPTVDAADQRVKIVERNLDGSMRRLKIPIAEKALELIALDEPTRSAVDLLLADRAEVIDAIVKENLVFLNQMRAERKAGSRARDQMRVIVEMFDPVLRDGPLAGQIASLLPEPQRDEYLGLIGEYREMMLSERRSRGHRGEGRGQGLGTGESAEGVKKLSDVDAPPGKKPAEGLSEADRRGRRGLQMQTLRLEIQRSIERISGERGNRVGGLISALDLSPEQESRVTAIVREGARKIREAEDKRAARREMMQALAAELTPEQQEKVREYMGGPPGRGDRAQRRQGKAASDG